MFPKEGLIISIGNTSEPFIIVQGIFVSLQGGYRDIPRAGPGLKVSKEIYHLIYPDENVLEDVCQEECKKKGKESSFTTPLLIATPHYARF